MFPFVNEVFAMSPGGITGGGGGLLQSLIPFALIFAIFWFLVIRPQQKKAKTHRLLLEGLKKGDQVVMDNGIFGTIQKLAPESVTVEIAPKVAVKVVRGRIAEVIRDAGGEAKGAEG